MMLHRFNVERRLIAAICALAVLTTVLLCCLRNKKVIPTGVFTSSRTIYIPVIDAGHGGDDGGAVSLTGVYESKINLDIAQRIRLIFALFGVHSVMTRDSDDIQYPEDATTVRARKVADQKARVELINSVDRAYLISIHQNYYPSSGPFGAQVLYAPTDESREFAIFLQDQLISNLNPENYRSASQISGDIYLMNQVHCPAVLIECGFLSNPTEDALLQTENYRLKLAVLTTAGFLRFHAQA